MPNPSFNVKHPIELASRAGIVEIAPMSDTDKPITLVLKPNLWRVIVASDVVNPQRVRHITVKGPATVRGAIDSAIHTDAFDDFKKEFPMCGIAKIEFMGLLDNA